MTVELYFNNIKNLAKALGLPNQIELDSSLGATLISNHGTPLILNISYDFDNHTMIIQTPITTHFPKSRVGVQSVMNQLVGDLLIQNRDIGRLVANPKDNSIELIKTIDLKVASEKTLATFVPLFTEHATRWRDKFDEATKESQKESFHQEKEIVSFNTL